MQIPEDLIKELVKEEIGSDAISLVLLLLKKENVSEFKIAEKMGLSVNQVRNILYRLNEKNLVYSTRKKDKKKGWYIYYWTFDLNSALDTIINEKKDSIREASKKIRNIGQIREYMCEHCSIKYDEEAALESQFKCTECGEVLKEINEEKMRADYDKRIKKFRKDIETVAEVKKLLKSIEEKTETRKEKRREKAEARKKEEKTKVEKEIVSKKIRKKVLKKRSNKRNRFKKNHQKVVKKSIKISEKPISQEIQTHTEEIHTEPEKKRGFLSKIFRK